MTLDAPRSARRRWVVLVAALLGALLTARLGLWQLDRAGQKLALQAQLLQRAELPPLAASVLARSAVEAAGQHQRRTVLQGRWLADRSIYLDNRQMASRQGFFVVTPLQLPDGDLVLVQRGWVPRSFDDRTRLPAVPTPAGLVQVPGRIAPPPAKLFALGDAEQGAIRQNLDTAALSREWRLPLRPLSLLQTDEARRSDEAGQWQPAPDGLLRQWAAPALDVGKHHGYAFQWFALCALIVGLTLWFQFLRPRVQP